MNVNIGKFHVYINHAYCGPYEIRELWELPGFSLETLVCLHGGEGTWQPASEFPAIQQFRDNPEQTLTSEEESNRDQQLNGKPDWRAAVIKSDVTFTPLYTRRQVVIDERSKTVNLGYLQQNPPAPEPVQEPRTALERLAAFQATWMKRRKGVLAILALISLGLNLPQIDNYMNVYGSMVQPQVLPAFVLGTRVKGGGLVHPWHPWKIQKTPAGVALIKLNPSADQITEVDTEELGDGTISKTVLVTHIVNGVKIHETKTYLITKHAVRKHRRHFSQ
jgi:hypothetical protein